MRFATRTFLSSFVPFALLLAVSFWGVRAAVAVAVRDRLRASARESQMALAREHARDEGRTRRMLGGVAANPALKAGLQLLAAEKGSADQARNTVRDQLSEMGDGLDYDLMMVSGADGGTLAVVVREAGGFAPLDLSTFNQPGPLAPNQRYFGLDGRLYELTSAPINEENEQVATLTVGARVDLARFGIPAVLLHNGAVVAAQMRDLAPAVVEAALRACPPDAECQPTIQDQTYLSVPLNPAPVSPNGPAPRQSGVAPNAGVALKVGVAPEAGSTPEAGAPLESEYVLRSLQSVDAASAPIQTVLERLFLISGTLALVAALVISAFTSQSVAKPLAEVALRLRHSSATGELPEFPDTGVSAIEIRELTQGFNVAAQAVRESREKLTRAYVEFAGSMAQALDARDAYTAGHSRRVSEYSCAIAQAMSLPERQIDTVRVGALLHDLGKIGISDVVLQKPGRLTAEEETLIRRHPVIGRRILENIHGMEPYLAMVELHHENWDGTGYPRGLKQEETPLHARIVKVADAYDAMTSDRPYRRGRNHAEAIGVLRAMSGTQMDPAVVQAFCSLDDLEVKEQEGKHQAARLYSEASALSLQNLAGALNVQRIGEQRADEVGEPSGAALIPVTLVPLTPVPVTLVPVSHDTEVR